MKIDEGRRRRIGDRGKNWWSIWIWWVAFVWIVGRSVVMGVTWTTGYYKQNDTWFKWSTSWKTWINGSECTSWNNRILNSTTKLWEFWGYGQFYSPQINKCIDWNGSWLEEWGYQDECYLWPQGMKYDLTLLECVNEWTSLQVYIEDPLLKGFPVWRDVIYNKEINFYA